jgi:hypothetical protein
MSEADREMAELERALAKEFDPAILFPSTAGEAETADLVTSLILPKSSRGRLPLTRSDFVVEENPARVEWERQVRLFIRSLRPGTRYRGHKINAPMIFEWATGQTIKEIVEAEGVDKENWRGGAANGSANMHLRHINAILKEYFGTPKKTTILGRPVGKAYTVNKGFRVERRKPACLTLWPEYDAGVLDQDEED